MTSIYNPLTYPVYGCFETGHCSQSNEDLSWSEIFRYNFVINKN